MAKSPHKRLSQRLNKTIQADQIKLSCRHPPSSDVIGIIILSEEDMDHGPHLGNATLMSYGFPSRDTKVSLWSHWTEERTQYLENWKS